MSRDLISSAYQVLSSNELEIQELVQRISSARYLDEETKEKIINELSAALTKRAADKADMRAYRSQQIKGKNQKKQERQADKFGTYSAKKSTASDKEKGVGSRTKDPKRKKELKDKAAASASKAGSKAGREAEKKYDRGDTTQYKRYDQ
jgi:hypothetical protein